ncbi:hypothetical protein [Mycobacterium celatum]|uniref:hypothetical protein n=1 Tax=Mycobacterium celatum TaxID=28045 RepID=UPI003B75BC62
MMVVLVFNLIACGRSAPEEILVVQQHSQVLARFTLPQLQNLPQVEIRTPQSRGAQVQKGPTVRSVLDAAHATGVTSVRVVGRGPQTLTAAELTDQVILNVTKRHTLKLAGAKLDLSRWVRDVTGLDVNP